MSKWAEKHFVISPEYGGARKGLIVLEPWQVEIFDSFSDKRINRITLMTAIQMIKTLFQQVSVAYTICQNPGPIAFYGPSDKDAELFSKKRFEPMTRDVKPLRALINRKKSRDSANTIKSKLFPGGSIEFLGTKSAANLGGRTLMVAIMDELDKFDEHAGDTGDPVAQILGRTTQFGYLRKIIEACSPTIEGKSRIEHSYLQSDQRKPYVTCDECGHTHILSWHNVGFDTALPLSACRESARYRCAVCESLWTEQRRREILKKTIRWVSQEHSPGHAGFWINHLYSTLPLHSLANLTGNFMATRGKREELRVFINDSLAELWSDEGERPEWERVKANAEDYEIGIENHVRKEVVCLTCGVDKQKTRLELAVIGHGPDLNNDTHSFLVDYQTIELFENGLPLPTTAEAYWIRLAEILRDRYKHPCGSELPIISMAIDCGNEPEPVYRFAERYTRPTYDGNGLRVEEPMTVLCIRGNDGEAMNAIGRVTMRESSRLRKGPGEGMPLITLGTGYLKQQFYSALLEPGEIRRVHIPKGMTNDWYRGVVAEKKVTSANGSVEWKKEFARNEPLDCWVYGMGAGAAFRTDRMKPEGWAKLRRIFRLPDLGVEISQPTNAAQPIPQPAIQPVRQVRPRTVQSPYITGDLSR